ncbi:MAG TPA: cache domain-containing protein, partial [Candidatus Methylomirabilis sp.]|nr:cache domain-containing protein [Candidatus Methylomirabilis sp.]
MLGRPRSVSIYRSLLGNLALVIVLLSGAIMTLTFIGSQQTVRRMSGQILRETIGQIDVELRHFFDPVVRNLDLLRAWSESGLLDVGDQAALNRLLVPVMRANPQVSAVILADERGRSNILFHFGDEWSIRETRRDTWGDRAAWLEWTEARPEPVASWKTSDYDPRDRPWFQGARAAYRASGSGDVAARVYWTRPYTFYTANAPGLTAALAFRSGDGLLRMVALDVLLTDISRFTTRLRAGAHGEVMVLTDDDRVIGLPNAPRYQSFAAQIAALMKRPAELDMPVVADAARALRERPGADRGPVRLESRGERWWVDMSPFPLGPDHSLLISVMVPESDLVGSLGYLRLGIVLVML